MAARHYRAPWGIVTLIVSIFATTILLIVALAIAANASGAAFLLALMPLVFLFGTALFTVRGYTISNDILTVQRLLWTTDIPLLDLRSVKYEKDLMKGSWRVFGNGGLFSLTGRYWSKRLGKFRALVMDHTLAVLLTFRGQKIVVSPENPEEFVQELKSLKGL